MTPQQKNAKIAVSKTLDKLQQAMNCLPNKEKEIKMEIELIWDELYNKYK